MNRIITLNTEQEAQVRKLIEGGATYAAVATTMKVSTSALFQVCKKLGIHQPKTVSAPDQIVALCRNDPKGKDSLELSKATGIGRVQVNKHLSRLIDAGVLHKAGVCNFYRYFTSAEAASQHDEQVEIERKQKLEAKREAEKRNAPEIQKKRREQRALRAEQAKQAKQALPIAEPKPLIVMPEPEVVYRDGKKVLVIPTPPGRFDFTPSKGWRGQITSDWLDRRLQGAGA